MSALRKVLVVDDDPVVGKSFNRVLSQEKGYVVITAQNAAEALEKMREQEYDVVFTDIKMPGMDGVELAETVKARRPWTPVVIVTGYGSTANEMRAKAAGVSAFMHKPLSPEMIEESAAQAMHATMAEMTIPAPVQIVREEPVAVSATKAENKALNIALFLAAPFIGLAYALMLPLVGVSMLLWQGGKALARNAETLDSMKFGAKMVLAPFIGLAFALLLPLVGMTVLAWTAGKALVQSPVARVQARRAMRFVGLAATPFVGLAYILALPVIGMLMFVWFGLQAMHSRLSVR
jgi:CheY-like chemotaxis protein